MDKEMMIGLFAFFSVMLFVFGGCVSEEEVRIEEPIVSEPGEVGGEMLKFVVQPCWSPTDSFRMFNHLTTYLSRETGLDIQLIVVGSEEDFHGTIRDADFVLQDSFSAYTHNGRITAWDPLAIAVSEGGESEEEGAIIVRADSGIKDISDLRGKSFLFGAAHNAPKFLAAYVTLKKSGVDPENDLKSYGLGGDCSDNAMSVFLREYDGGVVCKDFVGGKEGRQKFNFETDLKVVADTIPVSNWILMASKDVDDETAGKVRKALLQITPESAIAREVLGETEWVGFVGVTGEELTEINDLVWEYSVPLLEG